jgi:hypothetical protein
VTGSNIGIAYTGERKDPPDAPFFVLEMKEGGSQSGLVFAAGVCSEVSGLEELEMRRYTMALLHEFFKKKGKELEQVDYGLMLRRTFHHIHHYISEKWSGQGLVLDLTVVIADTQAAYAARSGDGGLFVYHEGEARSIFQAEDDGGALLGSGSWETAKIEKVQLQPGDMAVLCDPAVSRVIGPRDVTVILRRASDPAKASLFLSAIAERKGAEGSMTALIWEVPNYQGAAMLTEETPAARQPETGGEVEAEVPDEDGAAEFAKRQWLSKWRRRKE